MTRRILLFSAIGAVLLLSIASLSNWRPGMDAIAAQPAMQASASTYQELLARYVSTGSDGVNRVDYAKWKANAWDVAKLKAYVAGLSAQKPSGFEWSEAFAYWANLYNAITL